jgi:outer membrane protein TolC
LLARRPDVRTAERTLAADTARVGVATAALYPSITLLGSIGIGAGKIGDVGKNEGLSWSVGPLISWNFPFNGAARARVRENKAIAQGSLAAFDKAVLVALQEAQQALARLAGALDREGALNRAVTAADKAAFLSGKRFDYGADNFLQLLDAQRTLASARSAAAQAQLDRATAQITLFKALGGGWQDTAVPREQVRN